MRVRLCERHCRLPERQRLHPHRMPAICERGTSEQILVSCVCTGEPVVRRPARRRRIDGGGRAVIGRRSGPGAALGTVSGPPTGEISSLIRVISAVWGCGIA